MYYALTLGYQVTGHEPLKQWALAGGDNFANIFDRKANAFLQIAGADRIVIDTGLNLPSMLWASQWEPARAALAYRHLDTVLEVGLVRADGANCHAAALDPQTRAVTGLFSLQGWSNSSVWARGQAWAMLGFAHAYEASHDRRYLDVARLAAEWYVVHAPPGWVPRYDYDDPDREILPYDSCAACIATAVLLRLARWLPDRAERYQERRTRNAQGADCQLSDAGRRRAARHLGTHAPCRAGQAPSRPVPAGRCHAVWQLLDRRMSLSRNVG